jgi:hypothetical protein
MGSDFQEWWALKYGAIQYDLKGTPLFCSAFGERSLSNSTPNCAAGSGRGIVTSILQRINTI